MTEFCEAALKYAQEQKPRFLEELKELVSIPSISTDPNARPQMEQAAGWVASQLRKCGMTNVAVMPTTGHFPSGLW